MSIVLALALNSGQAFSVQPQAAERSELAPLNGLQKPERISPFEAYSQSRLAHHRNQKRLKSNAAKPKHEKRGDVAVVIDHGTIVTKARPENLVDLVGSVSIDFTPAGEGYAVSLSDGGRDVFGSQPLEIFSPTDAVEIPLGFTFQFFGRSYTSVWVNGAGNLTFGAPDTDPFDPAALRDLPRFSAGPPRAAPLYADLAPDGVWVETLPDRVVITWVIGEEGIQAVLRADGSVRFSYPRPPITGIGVGMGDAVVGLSPGEGRATLQLVDYVAGPAATFGRGVIAEPFGAVLRTFDLSLQSIAFAPIAGGFALSRAPAGFDPNVGPALAIGDDGQAEVPLPFAFPFLGQAHDQAVISDDGTIGFGGRCSATVAAFLAGGPCIVVYGANLRPDEGGTIHAAVHGDRLVVTWSQIPSSYRGLPISAQATLYSDGRVVVSYPQPVVPTPFVVVGLTGGGVSRPTRELDFSADLPITVSAGPVLEAFVPRFQHFDLLDTHLTFTPEGSSFRIERRRGGFDDAHHRLSDLIPVGCELGTPGCESTEVPLPFAFPFLGQSYDRLFVNASGNVTFGVPDPQDVNAALMLGGPPRITPFGFSGDPGLTQQLGRVSAFADAERAVITWNGVVTSRPGFTGEVTMQLLLTPDGAIRMVYSSLPRFGLTGLAAGSNQEPIHEIDMTADQPQPLAAGMIFEQFVPAIPFNTVDIVELTQSFYAAQPDKFDFLVIFTDFPVPQLAFEVPVSNATAGLGLGVFDNASFFGSSGELESVVWMNNIKIYWPDAERLLDPPIETHRGRRRLMGLGDGGPVTRTTGPWGLSLDSPVSLLAQEVGHRWLAAARFVHPQTGVGSDSGDLLGFASIHWSFFANTALPAGQFPGEPRASAMEGNVIRDLGGPSFAPGSGLSDCAALEEHAFITDSLQLVDGYNTLDQYFMGLRTPSEVEPLFYVDNPTGPVGEPLPFGQAGALAVNSFPFCGTRTDVTPWDIIAHPEMGPRIPPLGDENDDGRGTDAKTMAFLLLTINADHEEAVKRVDTFRKAWQRYANGFATGMRGRFDTSLDPRIH